MSYVIFKSKSKSKSKMFWGKNAFCCAKKALLYDADWAAITWKLDGKSMLIADLFHVNRVQDDELKALNASNIYQFCLFLKFVLSKKTN